MEVCFAPISDVLGEVATSRNRTFIRKNGSSSPITDKGESQTFAANGERAGYCR